MSCTRVLDSLIYFPDLPAVIAMAVVNRQLRQVFQFSAAAQHTVD